MADMGKKRGRGKYKYLNISRTKKKIFWIVFEGLTFGEKLAFDKK